MNPKLRVDKYFDSFGQTIFRLFAGNNILANGKWFTVWSYSLRVLKNRNIANYISLVR